MMRIVFFTNKSARGATILASMMARQLPIDAIFIDVKGNTLRNRAQKVNTTMKRMGVIETIRLVVQRLRTQGLRRKRPDRQHNRFYAAFSDTVYTVYDFNSTESETLLRTIAPDLVVIGGSRILRRNIINIPKVGILNAHPGLLPAYRGVDVVPWAIYYGDPVGVTIHFIDPGVDTGAIIAQKTVDLQPGDTLRSLMKRVDHLAGAMMAETVCALMQQGGVQAIPQAREQGTQYYRMPLTLRQEAERRLQNMIADMDNGADNQVGVDYADTVY